MFQDPIRRTYNCTSLLCEKKLKSLHEGYLFIADFATAALGAGGTLDEPRFQTIMMHDGYIASTIARPNERSSISTVTVVTDEAFGWTKALYGAQI